MHTYQIVFYEDSRGRRPVEEFLNQLPEKVQTEKLGPKIAILEEKSPGELPGKYYKKLQGVRDLWEIRERHQNVFYRIFYFYAADQIVLVHGFYKNSDETNTNDIDRALRRMDEWKGGN